MAYRVEVFPVNMIKNSYLIQLTLYKHVWLLNSSHLSHKILDTSKSGSPQCLAHRKLSPSIPATKIVHLLQPWSWLPLQIITNDHLPSKQSTDPMILYDLTMVEMTNIIQPRDNIFFTKMWHDTLYAQPLNYTSSIILWHIE